MPTCPSCNAASTATAEAIFIGLPVCDACGSSYLVGDYVLIRRLGQGSQKRGWRKMWMARRWRSK